MNPLCSCSLKIEDTLHYFLHSHHFYSQRIDLMSSLKSICDSFKDNQNKEISKNNIKMCFYTVTLILMKTKINLV